MIDRKSFRNWVIAGGIALVAYVIYISREFIPALIVAVLLAYLLHPIVELLKRKLKFPHTLAVIFVFILTIALFATTSVLVVQYFVVEIQNLAIDLQGIMDQITRVASEPIQIYEWEFDPSYLVPDLSNVFTEGIPALSENAFNVLEFTSKNMVWGLTILVASFYLLMDWRDLRDWFYRLIPGEYQKDAKILYRQIVDVWRGYLLGNLVLMLIVGVAFSIAWVIIGLPGALFLGILGGLLTFIPDLGPFIAALLAVVVGFFQGSTVLNISNFWFAILIMVIYFVLINIKGVWIRPVIFAKSTRIHEGLIFLVIMISLVAWGILGALIVVPLVASVGIISGYFYKTILGIEPFADSMDDKSAEVED